MIYNLLRESKSEYASLHNERDYKFFTFSRLEIPKRKATNQGLRILSRDCYLWFSSVDHQLANIVANKLMQKKNLHFGGVDFSLLGISVPNLFEPESQNATFTTLSPILVRIEEGTGSSQTWDLSPDTDDFSKRLVDNIHRKYEFYHDKKPTTQTEVIKISNTRQKRIWIKETSHRAHLMDIEVRGEPELLKFAYDCGLGQKNSMGFGMIEVR